MYNVASRILATCFRCWRRGLVILQVLVLMHTQCHRILKLSGFFDIELDPLTRRSCGKMHAFPTSRQLVYVACCYCGHVYASFM